VVAGRAAAPVSLRPASPARIWAALLVVYVVWGSTYLGILLAIKTLPVFLGAAIRFLVAGAFLYAWSIRRGNADADRPVLRHWVTAAVVGAALLLGGNGLLSWAELRVDSGTSALVIATVPLWMALLDRIAFGQRLSRTAVGGLVVGLGGAVLLGGPTGPGRIDSVGAVVLVLSALCWTAGSLYSRRARLPQRPLVGASMEMLAGGVLLAVLGLSLGEAGQIADVSLESALALVYLIVFGSLVAFSAYIWLLRVAPTSLVSTYAYVNPVVAVFLGWAIESEPVGVRTVLAGGMILVAVALIVGSRPARPRTSTTPAAAAPARAR
jgi:drug/metabolite transporter (DMT)-like permease